MKHLPDNECRRCGRVHDDVMQYVDPDGRWAVTMVACDCGHRWTMIHTAPANLARLRRWLYQDRAMVETPPPFAPAALWQQYRVEGMWPPALSRAS